MTDAARAARPTVVPVVAGLVGCLLAAGAMAGCTSVRSNLGTDDSACYLALPSATRAVGHHGRLIGVHLYNLAALRRQVPEVFGALTDVPGPRQRVCATAFVGAFRRGSVTEPHGLPAGPVAVVVSTTPSNRLLGTVILGRAPPDFGHPHIG